MFSLQPLLTSLLESLPPGPIEHATLNESVKKAIDDSKEISPAETRKNQWEYLLKNEVFKLAITEGKALKDPDTTYYNALRSMLDIVLTFTEYDECEQTFPFVVLQDLLETQTIPSCSHVFSWIEERSARLTVGLKPQKGKALILLRSLNDLLRRLSKMGTTTIFCGRILTFLSGVFPLGERSGVNLRGEYGPTWEGVGDVGVKNVKSVAGGKDGESVVSDAMQVDVPVEKKSAAQKSAEKKEEFYNTFWSLQLPFSKPPLFADPDTFQQFKESVGKVLPVIKEATAKERAMMGSRTGVGTATLKRKREPDGEKSNLTDYFFAKFLTSPDLTDLEIADTHFRRQFLFQLLILLNHLLTFTKASKTTWTAPNNRALQMDFTLEPNDALWVQETINKAMEELRQTAPNGRAFAESVSVILEREKNWVNWKNHLCAPFDKAPASFPLDGEEVGLFEATRIERENMKQPPTDWSWSHGSEAMSEIWEMGCRGLYDLENPFQPGDVKDFVKKIKLEDHKMEMRKKTLNRAAERRAAALARTAAPSPAPEKDALVVKIQEPSTPTASDTLVAPRPINPGGSPLHPSLPAKPSASPVKPPPISTSQDTARSVTPTTPAAPVVPVVTVSTPAPTTTAPSAVLVPAATSAPGLSEPNPPPPPPDEQLLKLEENKQRWAWLALRTARDQYLQHFGKIGTGDIELLAKEIEKEKQEREEKMQKGETDANGTSAAEDSPMTATVPPPPVDDTKADGEDVKMEET